jgi:hypothetical protein
MSELFSVLESGCQWIAWICALVCLAAFVEYLPVHQVAITFFQGYQN